MRAGDTYLIALARTKSISHLWIVVTDPNATGQVVIVSVTTLRHNADQTVVLQNGEHPFIRHQSSVFFGDALFVEADRLRQWCGAGIAEAQASCHADLVK